jgi:hypothetical protein
MSRPSRQSFSCAVSTWHVSIKARAIAAASFELPSDANRETVSSCSRVDGRACRISKSSKKSDCGSDGAIVPLGNRVEQASRLPIVPTS